MPKIIVLIGTLDTKGPELQFVRQLIEKRGHTTVTIDCGIMGEPYFEPTVNRQKVAAAADTTIEDILARKDKNFAIHTMAVGTTKLVKKMFRDKRLDGVMSLGGGQGTIMGTRVMQSLPFGVPKVMVSAIANGQTAFGPFVGIRDLTIIHSVADLLGLNKVTRHVLAEGAGAVIGMVETDFSDMPSDRPTIAMTTAGVTTGCAMHVRDLLDSRGYDVIAFHCNGIGAQAMEELAADGQLDGILDISPKDIPDLLFGGIFPASPHRMEATCRRGIPQIIVPGTCDFILHAGVETLSPDILKRKHVIHNPIHTHVRATHDEMVDVGRFIAEKLSYSKGPAQVLIPKRGFTQLNIEGGPMFDPDADSGFLKGINAELKKTGAQNVAVEEFDMHINDSRFAEILANRIDAMVKARTKT
jgi:uncharacterized protein (UPF0261 family)